MQGKGGTASVVCVWYRLFCCPLASSSSSSKRSLCVVPAIDISPHTLIVLLLPHSPSTRHEGCVSRAGEFAHRIAVQIDLSARYTQELRAEDGETRVEVVDMDICSFLILIVMLA